MPEATTPVDRIVLVGFMGAGKTTVGAALAGRLGWPHRDCDRDIEALTGSTGAQIVAADGVDSLHQLEEAVLLGALADPARCVVSAAGWVVESTICRLAMARRAAVVWLSLPTDDLEIRMASGSHRRPVSSDQLVGLVARRGPVLQAIADLVVDARSSVEEIVDEVVRRFELLPPA
jgi:shikimate kinase